jgi:DNA-binding NarL/FixJ family response regulator
VQFEVLGSRLWSALARQRFAVLAAHGKAPASWRTPKLVVENHATVRRAICGLLELVSDFKVVGVAADGAEALQKLKKLSVDIVLADIFRPGTTDLSCLYALQDRYPAVRTIVISLDTEAMYVQQALRAGVSGYLLKNFTDELEPAIRAVAAGGTFFSRAITDELAGSAQSGHSVPPTLTPRQLEVLKLIARGYSTKELADRLRISVKTAQTHRTDLMQRLDLHDVAGVVRYAIRQGLIRPD